MAAIVYGLELGLTPMSALQNLAVINGKVSMYGDLLLGMCMASPDTEYIREASTEEIAKTKIAWCIAKRKGKAEVRRTFSLEDAITAQLAGPRGKDGPWKTYENRMLMMRARGWALRDAYADRLKGLIAREEAADFIDVTPPRTSQPISDSTDAGGGDNSLNAKKALIVTEASALLVQAWPGQEPEALQAKRELIRTAFGVKWKDMMTMELPAMQAGYRALQEAIYPPTHTDEDLSGLDHDPDETEEDVPHDGTRSTADDTTDRHEVNDNVSVDEDDALAEQVKWDELQDSAMQAGMSADGWLNMRARVREYDDMRESVKAWMIKAQGGTQ
jgi:hypothetical protein